VREPAQAEQRSVAGIGSRRPPKKTFISHLIVRLGLDPVRVSKIAGHANVSVTLNVYAEEFDKAMHREDLMSRIEKAGFGSLQSSGSTVSVTRA
jgi:integrase